MTRSRKAQGRGEEDCNDKKQKKPEEEGKRTAMTRSRKSPRKRERGLQ